MKGYFMAKNSFVVEATFKLLERQKDKQKDQQKDGQKKKREGQTDSNLQEPYGHG